MFGNHREASQWNPKQRQANTASWLRLRPRPLTGAATSPTKFGLTSTSADSSARPTAACATAALSLRSWPSGSRWATDLTDEDILRALGREIEPDGVEPGGSAAADPVAWPHDESGDAYSAPAVLPPRVELNGACGDVLRALGLPDQSDRLEQRRNPGTAQIDWGDEQPDSVWLDLYDQGLVDPPYRGPNAEAVADVLDQRKPVRFKDNTEDILRALGRL